MTNKLGQEQMYESPYLDVFFLSFLFLCFLLNLFTFCESIYRKLGWQPKPGESHLDAMLRGNILTTLALFGHEPTINEASRRFHAYLDDRNMPLLPPDIRKVVFM